MEQFEQFGRGSPKEHSCKIILKLDQWPRRRCRFKAFLFLALVAILFSEAEPFRQNLVEGHTRNIPVKLFQNPFTGLGGDVF